MVRLTNFTLEGQPIELEQQQGLFFDGAVTRTQRRHITYRLGPLRDGLSVCWIDRQRLGKGGASMVKHIERSRLLSEPLCEKFCSNRPRLKSRLKLMISYQDTMVFNAFSYLSSQIVVLRLFRSQFNALPSCVLLRYVTIALMDLVFGWR